MNFAADGQKKLLRLRTFQDDLSRARNQNAAEATPSPVGVSVSTPLAAQSVSTPVQNDPVLHKSINLEPKVAHAQIQQVQVELPQESLLISAQQKDEAPAVSQPRVQNKQQESLSENFAQVAQLHSSSILTDDDEVHTEDSLAGGKIIRDTKHKRFRLFSAIIQALIGWTKDTKTAYEKAVTGTVHNVAKAETRVSIIKKAAQQTSKAPKDDFKIVAEHLKTLERKPIHTSITLREKSEIAPSSWDYVVDAENQQTPVVPAVTETVTENVVPTQSIVEEQVAQAPNSYEPQYELPTEEVTPPAGRELYEEKINAQADGKSGYEEYIQETPSETVILQDDEVASGYDQVEALVPEVQKPEYAPIQETYIRAASFQPLPQRRFAPAQSASSRYFYILIGVIIFASVFGVGVSYYFFAQPDTKVVIVEQSNSQSVPDLIDAQHTIHVVLPSQRRELLEVIQAAIVTNTAGIAQVHPTISTAEGAPTISAGADDIVNTLALKAPGSFTRAIKEITFGGIDADTPFIVMRMTNFDTAFAGMLAWEPLLSVDLSPLFGDPVTESYDPQVRTFTQTSTAFFKDSVASNKNVRVLLDDQGKDRVIYTFINQNTLLITTTREALATLIPLIK